MFRKFRLFAIAFIVLSLLPAAPLVEHFLPGIGDALAKEKKTKKAKRGNTFIARPHVAAAYDWMGDARRSGEWDAPAQQLMQLKEGDLNPYERALVNVWLAEIHFETGKYKRAIEFYRLGLDHPSIPWSFENETRKVMARLETALSDRDRFVAEESRTSRSENGGSLGRAFLAVPVVRAEPIYPFRARQAGLEGKVVIEFAITDLGLVADIRIVESNPPGYFERAAISALKKYRYRPKFVDGIPVRAEGIRTIISFSIADN